MSPSFTGFTGSGTFGFPIPFTFYISRIIAFRSDQNIVTSTLCLEGGNVGTVSIFLSNDDGVTWEAAVNATQHVFNTTGQKLRFRLAAQTGTTVDAPVRIDYTTT